MARCLMDRISNLIAQNAPRAGSGPAQPQGATALVQTLVADIRQVASKSAVGDMGTKLEGLSKALDDAKMQSEGNDAYAIAAEIYRDTALVDPKNGLPTLSQSLHNRALSLHKQAQYELARAMFEETIQLRHQLSTRDPKKYRLDLAASLISLGHTLNALHHPEESVAKYAEAIQIYRVVSDANDAQNQLQLASALNYLGLSLYSSKQYEGSVHVFEEVAQIRQKAPKGSETYASDLAAARRNLDLAKSKQNESKTPGQPGGRK